MLRKDLPNISQIRALGFDLGDYTEFLCDEIAMDGVKINKIGQMVGPNGMAFDAPVTTPNAGVPIELSVFFDPKAIEILTSARKATEIYNEQVKGDWTTPVIKYRTEEFTGSTQPYGDFQNNGRSSVNYSWPQRDTYLFQDIIEYGDYEQAVTSAAKINYAADKQRSSANIISIDSNKFYFYGVANRAIYGLLNDPGLTTALTPATKDAGGVLWSVATTNEKYKDVLTTFAGLVDQLGGLIDQTSKLKLVLSPGLNVDLGDATDFNVSVQDMLNKYFSNLEIVTAPEMVAAGVETMQMIAPEVLGQETGNLVTNLKLKTGRIIPDLSSNKQKIISGTSGAHITVPAAIKQMRGM